VLRDNIFAEIVNAIGRSWDEWYGRLKNYKEREGHCRVPQGHRENGYRLGQWVAGQRSNKEAITAERRQRLNELGFVWDPYAADWEEGFRYLKIYRERTGHCVVPVNHKENGYPLGYWVDRQRQGKERGTLSAERERILDELGFVWEPFDVRWLEGLGHLKSYREREGHCAVPAKHKENGYPLGQWIRVQRIGKDKLSAERRQKLDQLGFVWNVLSNQWEEGFRHLKIYHEREGHCAVPTKHKENGYPLGQWINVQRRGKDKLPAEQRQRLDDIGFVFDILSNQWEEGFRYLKIYHERQGHCAVPTKHKENGYPLGQWINVQRRDKDKLSAERRQKLDQLGFVWNALESAWEEGFRHLRTYHEREGHCRVPVAHIEGGFPLGRWVSVQRRNDRLPAERRQRLGELGFVWGILSNQWEEGFRYLKIYHERERHCRVPVAHIEGGFRLGRWISNLRLGNTQISEEQRQRLDDIGFVWDVRSNQWEEGFRYLKIYHEREGHCRVPVAHIEGVFRLGRWVDNQRTRPANEERRQRLDDLGFVWKIERTSAADAPVRPQELEG
jgi:hypothetical protein